MNHITSTTNHSRASRALGATLMDSVLFAVAFMVLLPVAMAAAMTGWRWQPWPPGARGYRTFIHEAKIAASTATAFSI